MKMSRSLPKKARIVLFLVKNQHKQCLICNTFVYNTIIYNSNVLAVLSANDPSEQIVLLSFINARPVQSLLSRSQFFAHTAFYLSLVHLTRTTFTKPKRNELHAQKTNLIKTRQQSLCLQVQWWEKKKRLFCSVYQLLFCLNRKEQCSLQKVGIYNVAFMILHSNDYPQVLGKHKTHGWCERLLDGSHKDFHILLEVTCGIWLSGRFINRRTTTRCFEIPCAILVSKNTSNCLCSFVIWSTSAFSNQSRRHTRELSCIEALTSWWVRPATLNLVNVATCTSSWTHHGYGSRMINRTWLRMGVITEVSNTPNCCEDFLATCDVW